MRTNLDGDYFTDTIDKLKLDFARVIKYYVKKYAQAVRQYLFGME